MATTVFEVPEQFGGKTLEQVAGEVGGLGRVDVLANLLGINQRDVLKAGQGLTLNDVPGVDPSGSAELIGLRKAFGSGITPEQFAAQPAIRSLESSIPETEAAFQQRQAALSAEKQPLESRYSKILEEIKGREQRELSREETALSREFGKRGIPLSSGVFDVSLGEKLRPISEAFGEITSETAFGFENLLRDLTQQIAEVPTEQALAVRDIRNAIAQIQAGAGSQAIQNALAQAQLSEEARQFDVTQQFQEKAFELEQNVKDFNDFWNSL